MNMCNTVPFTKRGQNQYVFQARVVSLMFSGSGTDIEFEMAQND